MTPPAIRGVVPPATTPFDERGELDLGAIAHQIDWLVAAGCHGIAAGGSTGEGHAIDAAEFESLIKATVDAAGGRVPVIAGVIADSTREAVRRGLSVRDVGVAALQVTPVHYLFRPHDEAMVAHFRTLTEETGLPVVIYNVVPWTYLSPELLCRILREVPGVVGVKQSAGDLKLFADLMALCGPDDIIMSAVDALMYCSYTLGAHGSIAAILTAAPTASVALWDAVAAGDHARARDLHLRLLALWNAMSHDNLPACVKYAQSLQGVPAGYARAPMPAPDDAARAAIGVALEGLCQLRSA